MPLPGPHRAINVDTANVSGVFPVDLPVVLGQTAANEERVKRVAPGEGVGLIDLLSAGRLHGLRQAHRIETLCFDSPRNGDGHERQLE